MWYNKLIEQSLSSSFWFFFGGGGGGFGGPYSKQQVSYLDKK